MHNQIDESKIRLKEIMTRQIRRPSNKTCRQQHSYHSARTNRYTCCASHVSFGQQQMTEERPASLEMPSGRLAEKQNQESFLTHAMQSKKTTQGIRVQWWLAPEGGYLMGWVNQKRLQEELNLLVCTIKHEESKMMPQQNYDQADDNGQATRHAGSSIPIKEHPQIDIHAVHHTYRLADNKWPRSDLLRSRCLLNDSPKN